MVKVIKKDKEEKKGSKKQKEGRESGYIVGILIRKAERKWEGTRIGGRRKGEDRYVEN